MRFDIPTCFSFYPSCTERRIPKSQESISLTATTFLALLASVEPLSVAINCDGDNCNRAFSLRQQQEQMLLSPLFPFALLSTFSTATTKVEAPPKRSYGSWHRCRRPYSVISVISVIGLMGCFILHWTRPRPWCEWKYPWFGASPSRNGALQLSRLVPMSTTDDSSAGRANSSIRLFVFIHGCTVAQLDRGGVTRVVVDNCQWYGDDQFWVLIGTRRMVVFFCACWRRRSSRVAAHGKMASKSSVFAAFSNTDSEYPPVV